jgi:transcriptional regulator with XRE-family HTH domain
MTAYGEVLAANIRAARARKGLNQADASERMRALGFTAWHRQTASAVEKGDRRLLAEEILGLASVLGVPMAALMRPAPEDLPVTFPSGKPADDQVWQPVR